MIILHQFPPGFGLINTSGFCVKLETWLRLAGLAYRTEPLLDLGQAPKGKGPYIEDDGVKIGDTALIIRHLKECRGVDPDDWLTPAQRGVGHAVGVMLEEHLYFAILYGRWVEPAHWPLVRANILRGLPAEVQESIQHDVHGSIVKQGLGRHSAAEIHALAVPDIEALADILGDSPFVLGDRPATVDCIAFGFVHSLLCEAFDGPLRQATQAAANLVAYERRCRQRFFPETLKAAV